MTSLSLHLVYMTDKAGTAQPLGACGSVWKNRDFCPVSSTGENGLRIIHSIPASLILNIFKIDKKAEESCYNCLGAMDTSAIEKVEKL